MRLARQQRRGRLRSAIDQAQPVIEQMFAVAINILGVIAFLGLVIGGWWFAAIMEGPVR